MISIETIKSTYGSEIAILLLCCRIHFKTASTLELQQLIANSKIDWNHFIYLCSYHRVEPVVYKILADAAIPASTAGIIKQKRLYLIQQSFKLAIETERIIKKLNSHGIECIPYKGAALCRQLYGDIISRESSDIDLVIAPHDFEKVLPLMKEDGYSFENQDEYAYFKDAIYERKNQMSFNKFSNEKREFHIEFHWRITENITRVMKGLNKVLFAKGELIQLARDHVSTINITRHYLAMFTHHAFHDGFTFFKNLIDISQITSVALSEFQIDQVQKTIRMYHLEKAAALSNFLTAELFGVHLFFYNTNLKQVSANRRTYFIEKLLNKKMLGHNFNSGLYNKSTLALKDTALDKFTYLTACLQLRFIPSAKDIRIFNLPKQLYFLYSVLKPFRSMFSRVSREEEKQIARQQSTKSSNTSI